FTDCIKTADGHDYKGSWNRTQSGKSCQEWSSQFPHKHRFNTLTKNYCRNPNGMPHPWCYTNDPQTRWEFCGLPLCAPPTSENAEECLLDPRGESYMGLKSTTKSGLTCQSWSIQSPHAHAFSRLLGNQKNYCRNPDGEPKPWCYTTNKTKRFELCEIPECAACNIYQEEGPDCKVVYKVSGNCYYKSHYRNECKYTVRLSKNKEGQGEVTIKYGKESFKILKDQHILKCAYFKNVGDYLLIEEKISDKC
ncbi:plasminogen-like, partial [Saccostrea cucullata]|uniref:plasminogen-like n=1 Tax=Saccostrea cuccullata TaxID=36930 RepID=UPI002ED2FDB9